MNGSYFIGAVILQPIQLGGGGGQNSCLNPLFLKIFFSSNNMIVNPYKLSSLVLGNKQSSWKYALFPASYINRLQGKQNKFLLVSFFRNQEKRRTFNKWVDGMVHE
jgi:hypothetical protein